MSVKLGTLSEPVKGRGARGEQQQVWHGNSVDPLRKDWSSDQNGALYGALLWLAGLVFPSKWKRPGKVAREREGVTY